MTELSASAKEWTPSWAAAEPASGDPAGAVAGTTDGSLALQDGANAQQTQADNVTGAWNTEADAYYPAGSDASTGQAAYYPAADDAGAVEAASTPTDGAGADADEANIAEIEEAMVHAEIEAFLDSKGITDEDERNRLFAELLTASKGGMGLGMGLGLDDDGDGYGDGDEYYDTAEDQAAAAEALAAYPPLKGDATSAAVYTHTSGSSRGGYRGRGGGRGGGRGRGRGGGGGSAYEPTITASGLWVPPTAGTSGYNGNAASAAPAPAPAPVVQPGSASYSAFAANWTRDHQAYVPPVVPTATTGISAASTAAGAVPTMPASAAAPAPAGYGGGMAAVPLQPQAQAHAYGGYGAGSGYSGGGGGGGDAGGYGSYASQQQQPQPQPQAQSYGYGYGYGYGMSGAGGPYAYPSGGAGTNPGGFSFLPAGAAFTATTSQPYGAPGGIPGQQPQMWQQQPYGVGSVWGSQQQQPPSQQQSRW